MAHPKSVLIERCQALGLKPKFSTSNTGPDHDPTFICDVLINDEVYGTGQAPKKSDAEKNASEEALLRLEDKKPAKQTRQKKASSNKKNTRRNTNDVANDVEEEQFEGRFEGQFEGPWPMFADVLASCINAANERVDKKLTGDKAVDEVQRLSLQLYKAILEDLSEIEEIDDYE